MPCPRCFDVELTPAFGALLEDVCAKCRGRFLPQPAVERVVVDELGISQDVLRELAAHFASKERLVCPSCTSKLSAVQVRKVRIDLCTGCGGAWLDGGELTTLTAGRYEELTPAAAAAAPAAAAVDAVARQVPRDRTPIAIDGADDGGRTPGRVVVFFRDPSRINRDALAAVFAKVPGLTAPDAAQIVTKQRPTVVEGATEEQAHNVVTALAAEGIDAEIADESWLTLPAAFGTNAITCEPRGLTLGRAVDLSGRVEVPWPSVAAIVAARIVRQQMRRVVTRGPTPDRINTDGTDYDVSLVEGEDVCIELVLANPSRRFRLMLSTWIFGESGRPRPVLLGERLAEIVQHAGPSLSVGRGVRAAIEGKAPPRYSSMKDLERELGWLLWRAFGSAR